MGIQTLRILGIDPGLANTGWGVVDMRGYDLYGAGSGSIRTPSSASLAVRLKTIHDTLIEIVREYRPQVVSIEKLFFAQNVKTAMSRVGQVLPPIYRRMLNFHYPLKGFRNPINFTSKN